MRPNLPVAGIFFSCLVLALSAFPLHAADPASTPEEDLSAAATPVATPTPVPSSQKSKAVRTPAPGSILTLHHKMLDPAWGRVIQYRKTESRAFSDKARETLHEFVLQDTDNIVRVATFHENAQGTGYWEVWVWDLP